MSRKLILISGAILYLFFVFICFAANAQATNEGPLVHLHTIKDFRGKISEKDTSFRLDSAKMRGIVKRSMKRWKNPDINTMDSATLKFRMHQKLAHLKKGAHRLMRADSISVERKILVRGDSVTRDVRRIVYFKPSAERNCISSDTVIHHDITIHRGMKSSDIPDNDPGIQKEVYNNNDVTSLNVGNLYMFPNPSNGQFKLSFALPEQSPAGIKIADLEGKTVWKDAISNGYYENNVDISAQPKGVYILEIMQDNKTMLRKLVVN